MSENVFWFSLWSMIGVCITIIAITGAIYSHHTNQLVLKADTCEKAAFIDGALPERAIAVCKIKRQQ